MSVKIIAKNRKAYFNYHILESIEVGIALLGTEVKSIKEGKVNFKDSYGTIKHGELFLVDLHVSPYSHGNLQNHEPLRTRKLLAHRREITRLTAKMNEKGLTLVPTSVYLKNGRVKVELGLAKGKKLYDKRETLKQKDSKRDMERAIRDRS